MLYSTSDLPNHRQQLGTSKWWSSSAIKQECVSHAESCSKDKTSAALATGKVQVGAQNL